MTNEAKDEQTDVLAVALREAFRQPGNDDGPKAWNVVAEAAIAYLGAQPGPVACEALTAEEVEDVHAEWLSTPPGAGVLEERREMIRLAATAQRAKCKTVNELRAAGQPPLGQCCHPDCGKAATQYVELCQQHASASVVSEREAAFAKGEPAPQEGTPLVYHVAASHREVYITLVEGAGMTVLTTISAEQAAAIADVLNRASMPATKEPTPTQPAQDGTCARP